MAVSASPNYGISIIDQSMQDQYTQMVRVRMNQLAQGNIPQLGSAMSSVSQVSQADYVKQLQAAKEIQQAAEDRQKMISEFWDFADQNFPALIDMFKSYHEVKKQFAVFAGSIKKDPE